jgi:DNA-binding SARP family transcriptional activator
MRRLCSVLLLGWYLSTFAAESPGKGLWFRSFEVDKDKRTSLNLTPDKPLQLPKGFSMTFDFKLSSRGENFGYIFRIIGNDNLNIDLLSDVSTSRTFSLIIGNKTVIQLKTTEIPDFRFDRWLKIKIDCHWKENKATLSINGVDKSIDYPFPKLNHFRICFGGNFSNMFFTNDIPPMAIRNIRIHNEKGSLVRNWELSEHENDWVYDSCKNAKAVAVNPVWEIDNHVTWQKRKTFYIPENHPKIAYDKQSNRFFIVGKQQLIIYDGATQTSDSLSYTSGIPINEYCNQLVYDEKNDRLIAYNFFGNELNYFDFESKTWTNNSNAFVEPRFWHNNKQYFPNDSLLIAVGGYGYHKYSALLQKYNVKKKAWEKYDLSPDLSPRYLASMGLMSDSILLLFGGYGSITGDQYELPHNYYDLYTINAYTHQVSKLWSAESDKENYTNANSLIYNEENDLFYTLSYSNKKYESMLFLHEYALSKPGFKILGDSIPYIFSDVESYCDLYFPDNHSELIAVTVLTKNANTEINLYAIAFPPLSQADVLQIVKSKKINPRLLIPLVLFPVLIVLFFILKQILKKRADDYFPDEDSFGNFILAKVPKLPEEKIIAPSIHLLGTFKILDSEGHNLSSSFTHTTKQIFLTILFATIEKKKGITSEMFRDLFWPDKEHDSARNSRNVYFNRIRTLLKKVGNLKISKQEEGYWIISDLKEVYCDYERILSMIKQFHENEAVDLSLLKSILDIAAKGKLLAHYEAEWLDEYKNQYYNLIIDFLLEIVKLPGLQHDLLLQLRISDIILLQDNTDETGICLKCKTLFRLGKKNQALGCFKKFSEEHKIFYGVETNLKFEDILK